MANSPQLEGRVSDDQDQLPYPHRRVPGQLDRLSCQTKKKPRLLSAITG